MRPDFSPIETDLESTTHTKMRIAAAIRIGICRLLEFLNTWALLLVELPMGTFEVFA